MLRAYRAGLLRPHYKFTLNSRIRESWMLFSIGAEEDARVARHQLLVKASFANLFEKPREQFSKLLEQGDQFGAYGIGDPVALHAKSSKLTQEENLRQIYLAMLESGELDDV